MAAREKRTKLTNAKIEEVLNDYQKSFRGNKGKGRNFRETSTGTDDTGLLTDDDRMTEDDFSTGAASTRKITTIVKPFKFSQRTPRKFTSFGTSRHSAAALGVFEASSNDNHASRLRYEAAKCVRNSTIIFASRTPEILVIWKYIFASLYDLGGKNNCKLSEKRKNYCERLRPNDANRSSVTLTFTLGNTHVVTRRSRTFQWEDNFGMPLQF